MQLLTPEDAKSFTELLSEQLHNVVFHTTLKAGATGVTQGYLVRTLSEFLPSNFEMEELPDRVQAYLRYLLLNGDIAGVGGTRYRTMPTYVVSLPQNAQIMTLRLCGDSSRDAQVVEKLNSIGHVWHEQGVRWTCRINDSYRELLVGKQRYIELPIAEAEAATNALADLKIPVTDAQGLSERLPSIESVRVPSQSAFAAIPPSFGIWHQYQPTFTEERWKPIPSWRIDAPSLLRWRPSDDWRGLRASRYFYHNLRERPAEYSESNAHLWMFHLDAQAEYAHKIHIKDNELRVPSHLPDPHRQWMQLFVNRLSWRETELQCSLTVPAIEIASRLAETLQLEVV